MRPIRFPVMLIRRSLVIIMESRVHFVLGLNGVTDMDLIEGFFPEFYPGILAIQFEITSHSDTSETYFEAV